MNTTAPANSPGRYFSTGVLVPSICIVQDRDRVNNCKFILLLIFLPHNKTSAPCQKQGVGFLKNFKPGRRS